MFSNNGVRPPQSPLRFILVLCLAVFVGELVSMFFLSFAPQMPLIVEAILDAALLIMLISPILYLFEFRPLAQIILERERAVAKSRHAHELLEQRYLELKILAEVSSKLQACNSKQEACEVVKENLQKLFVGSFGGLYTLNSSTKELEIKIFWGDWDFGPEICAFSGNGCFVLETGSVFQSVPDFPCHKLSNEFSGQIICAPLLDQQEILGLVTVAKTASFSPIMDKSENGRFDHALLLTLADQLALALANLGLRESLRNESIRDSLTGLYNRRYLEETLDREIQRAKRANKTLAIVMSDIDFFKCFNDDYGHDAGDFLLKELGSLLRQEFRGSDIACRYGGEELTIILSDISADCVMERMEMLRHSISMLKLIHNDVLLGTVTLSGGVAMFPENGDTPESLVKSADQALYIAKAAGRDQFILAAPK